MCLCRATVWAFPLLCSEWQGLVSLQADRRRGAFLHFLAVTDALHPYAEAACASNCIICVQGEVKRLKELVRLEKDTVEALQQTLEETKESWGASESEANSALATTHTYEVCNCFILISLANAGSWTMLSFIKSRVTVTACNSLEQAERGTGAAIVT